MFFALMGKTRVSAVSEKHRPEGWEGAGVEGRKEEEAACLGEFKFLRIDI